MGRGVIGQTAFTSGELSPKVQARAGTDVWSTGARRLENILARAQGGAVKRPGTIDMGETKFPNQDCWLIPYDVSETASYIIEAGRFYFRYWTTDGLVMNTETGLPQETTTPWTEDELVDLQWAQDVNTLYFVHIDHLPRKLTDFTMSTVTFNNGRAPLDSFNTDTDNLATVTGSWPTLTVDFTTGIGLTSADVGRAFYLRDADDPDAPTAFYGTISAVTDGNTMSVTGTRRFPTDTATFAASSRWAFGLMNTGFGCSAVALHEGRLFYGGFKRRTDLIVGSVAAAFDNFELENIDPLINDAENADKSFGRRLVSRRKSAIRWIQGTNGALLVGTDGGDYLLSGGDADILTPLTASAKAQTARGSAHVQPAVVDDQVICVQEGGGRIRGVSYTQERNGYMSQDLAIAADHITDPGVRQLAYQQMPYGVLWGVTRRGDLFGFTVERDAVVLGGHRHVLGGSYDFGEPRTLSVAVRPGQFTQVAPEPTVGVLGDLPIWTDGGFPGPALGSWVVTEGAWTVAAVHGGYLPALAGLAAASDPTEADNTMTRTVVLPTLAGYNADLTEWERSTVTLGYRAAFLTEYSSTASVATITWDALDAGDDLLETLATVSFGEGVSPETPVGQWLVDEFVLTLPPGTRTVKATVNVTGVLTASFVVDYVSATLRQTPVVYPAPPAVRGDAVFLAVRRGEGSGAVRIERLAEEFTSGAPRDRREPWQLRAAVEGAQFLDASATSAVGVLVADVTGTTPAIVRTATPHDFVEGDQVTFRRTRWTQDGVQSGEFVNFDVFRVGAVLSPVRFELEDQAGVPVNRPADLGAYTPTVEAGASVFKLRDSVTAAWLADMTVGVLADGAARDATADAEGVILLDPPAAIVTVGLTYTSHLESLPRGGYGGGEGDDSGRPMDFANAVLRVLDTIGGELGRGAAPTAWEPLVTASWDDPADRPPALFTGDKVLPIDGAPDLDATVHFRHSEPYPMEVLGIYLCAKSNMP